MNKLPIILLILLLASTGCRKGKKYDPQPETELQPIASVTKLIPEAGQVGSSVTIEGNYFGTNPAAVQVLFDGVEGRVESISPMQIRVRVPVAKTGVVVIKINQQTLTGPMFTIESPLKEPYTAGGVLLLKQADVEAFAAINKNRRLEITGDLTINGADIISLEGLSIINAITGRLNISQCLSLENVSIGSIEKINGGISLVNSGIVSFEMDKLKGATALITVSGCKRLRSLSFKGLQQVDNNGVISGIDISNCTALTDINFGSLSKVNSRLIISGTALGNLEGFKALESVGALEIRGNTALKDFNGLEKLTMLSLPPYSVLLSSAIGNGIVVRNNTELRTLSGLQNLSEIGMAQLTENPNLNDLCPLKSHLLKLAGRAPYTYRSSSLDWPRNRQIAALVLKSNGRSETAADALKGLDRCN